MTKVFGDILNLFSQGPKFRVKAFVFYPCFCSKGDLRFRFIVSNWFGAFIFVYVTLKFKFSFFQLSAFIFIRNCKFYPSWFLFMLAGIPYQYGNDDASKMAA